METATNRKYAWGRQTDYQTPKTLSAGALKQMIVTDSNALDIVPVLGNNAGWSHGYNTETDEWVEAHSASVQHEFPVFSQEIGKIFALSMSDTVTTPAGGTNARLHTMVPTDPLVTRQDAAVTYVERLGNGWFYLAESMVSNGWSLSGNNTGMLMAGLQLVGSGKVVKDPAVTFAPSANPTVTSLTNLHKLYNTQVSITPDDGAALADPYNCRYRSFSLNFRKTMLDAASYAPGCGRYLIDDNPTSGIIRSNHEFDQQALDFSYEVDLADSLELEAVLDQRPIIILLSITGGIIEGSLRHQLDVSIPIAKYQTTRPVLVDGHWRLTISGRALFSISDNRLFRILLQNNVPNYTTGW